MKQLPPQRMAPIRCPRRHRMIVEEWKGMRTTEYSQKKRARGRLEADCRAKFECGNVWRDHMHYRRTSDNITNIGNSRTWSWMNANTNGIVRLDNRMTTTTMMMMMRMTIGVQYIVCRVTFLAFHYCLTCGIGSASFPWRALAPLTIGSDRFNPICEPTYYTRLDPSRLARTHSKCNLVTPSHSLTLIDSL